MTFFMAVCCCRIDPPVVLQPGDELKMNCKFKTKTKNDITFFGESTSDEMCLVFFAYYPKTNFRSCVSYGALDLCVDRTGNRSAQSACK